MEKPCDVSCEMCGSNNVFVKYVVAGKPLPFNLNKTLEVSSLVSMFPDVFSNNGLIVLSERTGLIHYCRCCSYTWISRTLKDMEPDTEDLMEIGRFDNFNVSSSQWQAEDTRVKTPHRYRVDMAFKFPGVYPSGIVEVSDQVVVTRGIVHANYIVMRAVDEFFKLKLSEYKPHTGGYAKLPIRFLDPAYTSVSNEGCFYNVRLDESGKKLMLRSLISFDVKDILELQDEKDNG